MKKIFTILSMFFAVAAMNAQTITDDFESYADFTMNPTGVWTFVDVDQRPTYGITDVTFTNSYDTMAAIVFNVTTCSPALTSIVPQSGDKVLAFFNAVPYDEDNFVSYNDDWMISPALSETETYSINFWARSYVTNYGMERFKVGYSTTTNDVSAFTFIQTGNYVEVDSIWTEFTYSFPVGAKYIALNCVSQDAFILFLDDVTIQTGGGVGINEAASNKVSIYPNPVNDVLNVNAAGFDKVEIVNFLGQVVYSNQVTATDFQINTADLTAGVYFVRLSGDNTVTKKFVKE